MPKETIILSTEDKEYVGSSYSIHMFKQLESSPLVYPRRSIAEADP